MPALFRCHHCRQDFPTQLDRIEHKLDLLITEGEQTKMELDDKLAAISAAVDTLSADDARVLADLQALKDSQGSLNADQEAELDALLAKVQAEDAAVNAADPAPAAPADGSGDTPAA